MAKLKLRDMVVILPGILGSVLQKDGKDLWNPSHQGIWQVMKSAGNILQLLKLQNEDGQTLDLEDGVVATRIINHTYLIPGLIKVVDGYSDLFNLIQTTFHTIPGNLHTDPVDKPANLYTFPYDWRRDNRVTARRLQQCLEQRLNCWRNYTGCADAKVILIAHSMGGLVARYYLEVLEGWRSCKALFTFGTPYRGSVDALNFLVNGYKQLFLDLTEVMRSFDSVYQLMPIYKMLQIDHSFHRIAEIEGIPNLEIERSQSALKFHREIEAAVNQHLQDETYRRAYKTIPIVGIQQPTLQFAQLLDNQQLLTHSTLPSWITAAEWGGDGTVPYISAIPIELSNEYRETYIAERHSALQCHNAGLNQVRDRLIAMQQLGLEEIRGPGSNLAIEHEPAISLSVEDLYFSESGVHLRAQVLNHPGDGTLYAQIQAMADDLPSWQVAFQPTATGEWQLNYNELPSGLYRLRVSLRGSTLPPTPVTDVFEVVEQ